MKCQHCGEPFESFSPQVLSAYLAANDWRETKGTDSLWRVFVKQFGEHKVEIDVPQMTSASDYDRCVVDMVLINLHRVEQRPVSEVIASLRTLKEKS